MKSIQMKLSLKIQVNLINPLSYCSQVREVFISGELGYAYSGLSCNMSSTCYGGVYQGEYTPTEVKNMIMGHGKVAFVSLTSLKV